MIRLILTVLVFVFGVQTSQPSQSEAVALLDKAQNLLVWYRSLDDEIIQSRTPPETYREHIPPTELIQAAALLYSYRTDEHTDIAEQLLAILPYYKLTPGEMFEIYDVIGHTALREMGEIETSYISRMAVEAERFRKESLNNAEQIVLAREPQTALELMQAVDVLSVVGQPVFVRYYLRRLLAGTPALTPEQSVKIVETLGAQKLNQLAFHPDFEPLGMQAFDRIMAEAQRPWLDEEHGSEVLPETGQVLAGKQQPTDCEQFLKQCLDKEHFDAALTAIDCLAANGEAGADFIQSTTGRPRILVQAVVAKDSRVRFLALETIMERRPAEPFAGSSFVADTLVWFARSEGERIVLSGHPQTASAIHNANLFLGLGYRTDVATVNRDLFRLAAASPDVELVVVDARTPLPPVGEFVQTMRQDARTAEIPIAVLSGIESDLNPNVNAVHRNTMTEYERRHPDAPFRTSLSLTYPQLADEASSRWVRDDLLAKTGVQPIPAEVRLEMARQSLRWLRDIKQAELSGGRKIYHFEDFDAVVLDALHSERRVREGLELAAVVRSPAVQRALHDMSQNVIYPDILRDQARDALGESVERFGMLVRGIW